MATRSTIMDTNSYSPDDAGRLSPATRELVGRRTRVLGPSYRMFYRDPVHLVRGLGARLWDADGAEYLDVYNNVASVGHCHPHVVEAIAAQAGMLNTHTRYLHTAIVDYSEKLLATMPAELDQLMFMCTGSEANDLAVRVAQAYTGAEGIVITSEAYHGNSALTSGMSPALGSAQPLLPSVRMVPGPDSYRLDVPDLGAWLAEQVAAQIAELRRHGHGFAAFLADSIFSSDGVYPDPRGYLAPVIDLVHAEGGVFIADEVQPGFARTGQAFWGFGRHGVVPDLVTTGKPMGNGIPVSGLAARHEVLAPFGESIPYFNTFGGNPVSIAAAAAVLEVIQGEGLQGNADRVGTAMVEGLRELATRHECIGDVRGSGLYVGLEIVSDRERRTPDRAGALDALEELRRRRVLTSVCGAYGNIFKLRPPLVFSMDDVAWLLDALDGALGTLRR